MKAPDAGLASVLGEPKVLDVESEGEARTRRGAPPPLLEDPPPPCDAAAAAAEDASCEEDCCAMALVREDSSWPAGGCCPVWEGEKTDDVEEAADDLRRAIWRAEDGGRVGKLAVAGEEPARVPLGEGVLRWSWEKAADVDMGVRRVL